MAEVRCVSGVQHHIPCRRGREVGPAQGLRRRHGALLRRLRWAGDCISRLGGAAQEVIVFAQAIGHLMFRAWSGPDSGRSLGVCPPSEALPPSRLAPGRKARSPPQQSVCRPSAPAPIARRPACASACHAPLCHSAFRACLAAAYLLDDSWRVTGVRVGSRGSVGLARGHPFGLWGIACVACACRIRKPGPKFSGSTSTAVSAPRSS